MKRVVAGILVILMFFTFTACGKKGKAVKTENGDLIFTNKNHQGIELGVADNKINPNLIYKNIRFNEQMLKGVYVLEGYGANSQGKKNDENEALINFKNHVKLTDNFFETDAEKIYGLPILYEAGAKNMFDDIRKADKYNWIKLYFLTENGLRKDYVCKYEVKGNTIKFTGVEWNYDTQSKKLNFKLKKDIQFEYRFKLQAREMTLQNDFGTVTLKSGLSANGCEQNIYAGHYLTEDSPEVGDFNFIKLVWYEDQNYSNLEVSNEVEDESGYMRYYAQDDAIAQLSDNGLFKLTYSLNGKTATKEFSYILCDQEGIILFDNQNTYFFTDDYFEHTKSNLSQNIDVKELDSVDELDENTLKKIAQKKSDLTNDLTKAFKDAGIKVSVNQKTGELAMDATILFGGDSAEITKEGKVFLDKFIKAYSAIISNAKYDGFISKTVVEGHIAPVSGVSYESGLPFSKKRAENVLEYCLHSSKAVNIDKWKKTMEAVGFSNSKPIYKKNGEVDFEASRRVSFRFIINIKSAANQ